MNTLSLYFQKVIIFLCILIFLLALSILAIGKLRKPNIILITLDALRADHLTCYGYKIPTSPFMNDFIKDAFLFKKAISQSATTGPSIASMFTSKYPYTDCVITESFTLGKYYTTLAEFLRVKGYETYAIVGNVCLSREFGFDRGFGHYDDSVKVRRADKLTKAAIQLLKEKKNNKHFFLWLHYREPHFPYKLPVKYTQLFSKNGPISKENALDVYTIVGRKQAFFKEDIRKLTNSYDASIRFLDDNLRELFMYLKQTGLLQKSIIIITADHGESLGEHNIFDHNELYYNILRVPLIIRIPGVRGRCVNYPVALVDIFPTISELVGRGNISKLMQLRGESVFRNKKSERELFSEYPDRASLIVGNFRLFRNTKGEYELYDINSDPAEFNNLVSKDQRAFHLLKQKMDSFRELYQCSPTADKLLLDVDTKESLKSLGYTQ